jgi:hypothetical protein
MAGKRQVVSMDDSYRRVNQSKKRLAEFIARVQDMRSPETRVITVQQQGAQPFKPHYFINDPLWALEPLVSEIVQPLLIALNYMVCSLAKRRHPNIDDSSLQFPVCDRENEFKRRVSSELKGLGKKEVALIENLQPYNGNDWLRTLRDLAYPDKHRRPIRVWSNDIKVDFRTLSEIETKTPTGETIKMPHEMEMQVQYPAPIVFGDNVRSPVIETLQLLQLKVSDVLNACKPFFDV